MKLSKPAKYLILGILGASSLWLMYTMSMKPLLINHKLNLVIALTQQEECDEAFEILDSLPRETFTERYLQNQLIDATTKCFPQLDKSTRIIRIWQIQELLQKRVQRYPYETKSWIALAAYTNLMMANAQTDEQRQQFGQLSIYAMEKALALSPSREEIYDRMTYTFLLTKQYPQAEETAQQCLIYFPASNRCLAWKILVEIFLGERQAIDISPKADPEMRRHFLRAEFLHLLLPIAIQQKNYDQLFEIYERLIVLEGPSPAYSQSLALAYAQSTINGGYREAIIHALDFLDQDPSSKEQVKIFLRAVIEKTQKEYPRQDDRIGGLAPNIKQRIRTHFPGLFDKSLGGN